MIDPRIIAYVLLATTALIAVLFAYLQNKKRLVYLHYWTVGWSLLVLRHIGGVWTSHSTPSTWESSLLKWLIASASLALFCSAQAYAGTRPWTRAASAVSAFFGVWIVMFSQGFVPVSPQYGMAIPFLATGWIFWRQSRRHEAPADLMMALTFALWGAISLVMLGPSSLTGNPSFSVIATLPQLLAAITMVMVCYEEQARRVQRDILAVSSLVLRTSNFEGEQAEKTLEQILERVLSVAQLPSGLLSLHRDGTRGTDVLISSRLDAGFCREAQDATSKAEFSQMLMQAGGLLLLGEGISTELDSQKCYREFKQAAFSHGLRIVVAVGLQVKEQPLGTLLLASRKKRRFSPSELRLLLTLGHQIGMAVENSHLIQQTSRRSEELAVLNEIGRALSSTLDLDELFEKMYAALQRMFAVKNFYIALCDIPNNQLCFELEINDGVRLPKRRRPIGNHLTEYIVRTRQPLLFRENLLEVAEKLGVRPFQPAASFCGVPLMVCERAIGVMAVKEMQEGLFDEEHVEMMRVLASEASIAIENARLFREEQTKSRHLALLNNISRNAITTLNPDEMLAKIAEQLERGMVFDHIGIGLLNYVTKEVVVQAEAGRRRGGLGRHMPLNDSLVGNVARTGQMCIARDLIGENPGSSVLEDSSSAIGLPILYADQLHGVLYVETAEATEFAEETILLLQTLADLISGALHNAFTFQKAQEQAITDGLTGVKTHRFLMEALSAEWQRSTRGSRPFSLVLIDLDRFKFVNDFYGHLEGDLVLNRVGHILEHNCRRSDVVARYGGDEFVILMPETNSEQGSQFAQKLRTAIFNDGLLREKNITASFGVACFPEHGSTPQELIQVADASMYLSKHQGGNEVSMADHFDTTETKKWKHDVLEAYLGVTLKRMFATGPEAFAEIKTRLEQFAQSLGSTEAEFTDAKNNAAETDDLLDSPKTLPSAVIETVTSLALAIDSKDHYTQGHSNKVASYAALIAEELGLSEEEIAEVRLGGLLHDIGKVGIPEDILNKNGPLNPDEWELMKEHVHYGGRLLEPLGSISDVREMVLHHHEMFDGSGYPDGLSGNQIPLGARIIAIADAFDTISSERTYKKARPAHAAFSELARCAGTQFDPELVRLFVKTVQGAFQQDDQGVGLTARESTG